MALRSPRYITDKLQWVLHAAVCLVTGTCEFNHSLSHLLHEELHWFDVPERTQYKLGVTVHHCLQNKAPEYLVDCCTPVSADITYGQLLDITWPYHVTGSALLVVRPSLSQVRQSGTRYRTVSVTWRSTASDNCWRRTYVNTVTQHTQCSKDAACICTI